MPNENDELLIDVPLVKVLIATQFSQWKDLPIQAVASSGWDNKTFHLGRDMLVRLPSSREYEDQVEKEQRWLSKLSPFLPLPIPEPLAVGQPGTGYPFKWSVYRWIEGDTAASGKITDLCELATRLAQFLLALQRIDSTDGPPYGSHSFYRGGPLKIYDEEVRQALAIVRDKIDTEIATVIWEKALESTWQGNPVWVHGDISAGNLLVQKGQLFAVIDFGQLAVGDPACDLAIAWTLFDPKSREVFRRTLEVDPNTWMRGKAWALWKALITAADFSNPNNAESKQCWRIIEIILEDADII